MAFTFLTYVLFFFLSQLSFSSSVLHQRPKYQCLALQKFNETLTIHLTHYDDYPKTSRWNMSIDCCLWDGVICDEFTHHVIHLNLRSSGLVGKIDSNSSLFQLSHLQFLDLSWNDFSNSHISPEFGKFSSLTYLDLSLSYFSGQIPPEFSHLSKLQSLKLSTPNSLRPTIHDFKMLLLNLTQLRELHLDYLNISSTIPPNISSHITDLWLRNTGLYGIVPRYIFHLPNLNDLDLSENDKLSACFPKTKWNSSASLMYLYLHRVEISGGLPDSLGYLTSLQFLSLYNCSLSGSIPQSLSNLTHIEVMYLDYNSLSGTIPSGTFSHSSLRDLVLRYNQLRGPLPNSIQNLVSLEFLDLSLNNFSGKLDVSFFSNLTRLSSIYLSHNRISLTNENKVKVSLPESLNTLRLADCDVRELEFLRYVKHLHTLDLSNNKIQGRIPDWAWSNWMFSLTYLNVSHNMLTSVNSIPPYLYTIDLRSNFLQGSLPIPPNSTTFFFISNNSLSGEIPLSICNLNQLKILDLGRNNLQGAIPQCFGGMSNHLEVLDMHNNKLSGTLPTTFSNKSVLTSFNVRGNKLKGRIPRYLVNCKELQVIDFAYNHLNDTFLIWLGNLQNLQVLSLRSNKLHGSLRTSKIGNMFPSLQILDLSYNAFTGNLPMSLFINLKAMKMIDKTIKAPSYLGDEKHQRGYYQYSVIVVNKGHEFELVRILRAYTTIDLSSNSFEGHIPSTMGDLVALHTLNLSHNGFQGHIPQSLGSLSSIESLDLSANQLSGGIPRQLASLTFLEVFNLSYNHLEGCIPKGPQFATFDNNSYVGNDGLHGFPL